jgi:uncharacterized protein (TIGR02246 family)
MFNVQCDRRAIFATIVMGFFASSFSPSVVAEEETEKSEIRAVIARMEAAWNRGDFRGYMEGFANPDVVFVSRGEFQEDWQGTLDHYVRDYGASEETRGRLHFFDIRVEMLAPDAAQLISRYRLDRPVDPQDGINTRLMRKRDGKWVIALNHVSSREPATAAPEIHVEDVALFFRVYDAAGGRPTAEQLQRDYLDAGSEGLRQFAKMRNTTAARIAAAIVEKPAMYADARQCLEVLPTIRDRLARALGKLGELYPEAKFPPVTIAVGRGRPIAVGSPVTGIQVGLEALCATDWLNPDVEDRFVTVIAHEYAHVQQARELADKEHPTVLEGSLVEGAAELVSELVAGEVSYAYLGDLVRGREKAIETAFAADEDETDLSDWLYNTTDEKRGDLGYWVGYRIASAYCQRSSDKHAALREILQMTDAKAFLAKSGWYPGMPLEEGACAE